MLKDTEKIKELTDISYQEHKEEKFKKYQANVELNYGGKVLDYINTKKSDLKRHKILINNNESL